MITNLWPNPIHQITDVDFRHHRQTLIERFYTSNATINQSLNPHNTTVKGYQPLFDVLSHIDENIQNIITDVIDPISFVFWNELTKCTPLVPKNVRFVHKSWFVEYEPGGYQNLHMHKQSFFTNIWFLDIGEQDEGCGELHLQNPNPGSFLLGFEAPVKKLIPKTGDILTIPSWIQHNVTPTSDKRLVFVWDTTVMPA